MRYTITITIDAQLTPEQAEEFACELLADAREHLHAGEHVELERVERPDAPGQRA